MSMRWYHHLYMGEKAKRKRYSMIQKLRRHKFQPGAYVITPASNGNNILDIYPADILLQPYYEKTDLLVLGIGADYWESLEVARQIVDDMYQTTGGFNLSLFLNKTDSKV